MINVDSYRTQKGVYTTNQIPTRTERNAWHHDNVMETENKMKLMVKTSKNPYPSPLRKSAYHHPLPRMIKILKFMDIVQIDTDELYTDAF